MFRYCVAQRYAPGPNELIEKTLLLVDRTKLLVDQKPHDFEQHCDVILRLVYTATPLHTMLGEKATQAHQHRIDAAAGSIGTNVK